MNKKVIISILVAAAVLGGIFLIFNRNNSKNQQKVAGISDESLIFFYGEGCPHCINVEKFLEENKNVEETVKFEKLEVWGNAANRNLLAEKAKKCGINTNSIGAPLFWTGSTCLVGDVDIIAFFKEKASIQ
jgi:hypothetical protein